MIKKTAFLLSVFLLLSILAGCFEAGPGGTTAASTTAQTQPVQTTAPTETVTEPAGPAPDYIVVSTDYGDLRYQDQWVEYMRTETTTFGENIMVSFKAEVNGALCPLFQITIGDIGMEGAGEITGPDGKVRQVHIFMEEIVGNSQMTDTELNRLYAMQEEINYIIENLE